MNLFGVSAVLVIAVLCSFRGTTAVCTTVHSTPPPPANGRRLTWRPSALEIDSRFGVAATVAASCRQLNIIQGWAPDLKSENEEVARLLRVALGIDENDPEALAFAGNLIAKQSGDLDAAKEMVDRAVALNPNSALVWDQRGYLYQGLGQAEEAIRSFERAIRLSPLDPMNFMAFAGLASAFIRQERFDEAVAAAKKSLRKSHQTFTGAYRCLAAALAQLGREAEAREAAVRMLELDPNFRISEWMPGGGRWQSPQFIEGLRKAGLPE